MSKRTLDHEEEGPSTKKQKLEQVALEVEGETTVEEAPWLPNEMVCRLLVLVSATDLSACACVCSQWREVSRAEELSWVNVFQGSLSFGGLGTNRSVDMDAGPAVRAIFRGSDDKRNSLMTMLDKDGNICSLVNVPLGPNFNGFEEFDTDTRLYKSILKFDLSDYGNNRRYRLDWSLQVNFVYLENLVMTGQRVPGEKALVPWLLKPTVTKLIKQQNAIDWEGSFIPVSTSNPEKQPEGLKEGIKLHKYQLDAVSWMKWVENSEPRKFEFCYLAPWTGARSGLLLNPRDSTFVPCDQVGKHVDSVAYSGGVLADEMGLGKTMETLALILANPPPPKKVEQQDDKVDTEENKENHENEESKEETKEETKEEQNKKEEDLKEESKKESKKRKY
eukprot:TRINITY_DN1385_c1_g1_i1.p1 TRINITY_DN1385_c1_g1~~TRINITY_DN1385_c1_g1_i1.p1  ORF type:complete len:391 (-),score=99.57 TRINITY_DN1385_c1_g1_i1:71-1243(-)